MSKRHRKTKNMMAMLNGDHDDMSMGDFGYMEMPRGKKPRGKEKRQSMKRAYYDD